LPVGSARVTVALSSEVVMTNATVRTMPLNAASTWLAALAAMGFMALGLRALVAPATAAASFGVPVDGAAGLAFVQAFGARNVGLSVVALTLIVLDLRLGLAALFFAAALIAGVDFSIVATHQSVLKAAKHVGYVVGLVAFGVWFVRRRSGER
jgi:hypothetical protein